AGEELVRILLVHVVLARRCEAERHRAWRVDTTAWRRDVEREVLAGEARRGGLERRRRDGSVLRGGGDGGGGCGLRGRGRERGRGRGRGCGRGCGCGRGRECRCERGRGRGCRRGRGARDRDRRGFARDRCCGGVRGALR